MTTLMAGSILAQTPGVDPYSRTLSILAVVLASVGTVSSAVIGFSKRWGRQKLQTPSDNAFKRAVEMYEAERAEPQPKLEEATPDDATRAIRSLREGAERVHAQVEYYLQYHQRASAQQRLSFFASLLAGAICLLVVLVGASLVFFAQHDPGVITTITGILPGMLSGLLSFQSNAAGKRSDEMARELAKDVAKTTAVMRTVNYALSVKDALLRDRIFTLAALQEMLPEASPQELSAIISPPDLDPRKLNRRRRSAKTRRTRKAQLPDNEPPSIRQISIEQHSTLP